MTVSLKFYLDANLSNPLSTPLSFEQAADGSTGPQTRVIYLGSASSNRQFEAAVNSGVDPILLSVIDSQPGIGQEVSNVRLGFTPNDVVTAMPGAALALPATLLSGATNAIPIYIQVQDTTGLVGTDSNISLTTNNIVETAITP
jgi:hypothetical protein